MSHNSSDEEWDIEIRPKPGLFQVNLLELWRYRDLLFMFVKRDFVTVYKQTLLGPLWFFIQPLLTTITFIIVFGEIAKLSIGEDVPRILFYLCGVTTWGYFAEALTSTSRTFTENANIFGKVYFPRLIIPVSKVISGLIKFSIQLSLFLVFYFYFLFTSDSVHPNWTLLLLPYYLFLMALLGLGFGIIFSSLTTKYRDLSFLISFGVQLLMYATPVIYPLSKITSSSYVMVIRLNPMTSIVEGFRYAFLGSGTFDWGLILYSTLFALVTFIAGVLLFNRVEKSFMDTV